MVHKEEEIHKITEIEEGNESECSSAQFSSMTEESCCSLEESG